MCCPGDPNKSLHDPVEKINLDVVQGVMAWLRLRDLHSDSSGDGMWLSASQLGQSQPNVHHARKFLQTDTVFEEDPINYASHTNLLAACAVCGVGFRGVGRN